MKKNLTSLVIAFALITGITSLTSCKKEGCTDKNATNYDEKAKEDDGSCTFPSAATPNNPQPTPSDASAVFVAINTVTYTSSFIGNIETTIGIPVAFALDGTNLKDMGTVTCEGEELDKQSNNSYVFMPSASNATGVVYDDQIDWVVSGASFPAFSQSINGTFPTSLECKTATGSNVSTSTEFTLETTNDISYADSVIFAVYGPNGQLIVTESGNTSSHTFSASEMSGVGIGSGFVQITAYRFSNAIMVNGTEKTYFINEKVNTISVNFN